MYAFAQTHTYTKTIYVHTCSLSLYHKKKKKLVHDMYNPTKPMRHRSGPTCGNAMLSTSCGMRPGSEWSSVGKHSSAFSCPGYCAIRNDKMQSCNDHSRSLLQTHLTVLVNYRPGSFMLWVGQSLASKFYIFGGKRNFLLEVENIPRKEIKCDKLSTNSWDAEIQSLVSLHFDKNSERTNAKCLRISLKIVNKSKLGLKRLYRKLGYYSLTK